MRWPRWSKVPTMSDCGKIAAPKVGMDNSNLTHRASLTLSIGHMLAVWDILANKLSGTPFMESLTEDEKRAVWALEDICERGLVENGIPPLPQPEWNALVDAAKEHVRSIPVDCLD